MIKEIKDYKTACENLVKRFAKKQGIEHTDTTGGVYEFITQYYFSIDDIILDLEKRAPKGLIMQWQDDGLDYHFEKKQDFTINYNSYIMGLRYKDLQR